METQAGQGHSENICIKDTSQTHWSIGGETNARARLMAPLLLSVNEISATQLLQVTSNPSPLGYF